MKRDYEKATPLKKYEKREAKPARQVQDEEKRTNKRV